jgi:hypothetical protein
MNRRNFAASLAGLSAAFSSRGAAAESDKRPKFWMLETFALKAGTQPSRLHEHMTKHVLPGIAKLHTGPKIVLDALVAPHMPQMAVIVGFSSWEQIWSTHEKAGGDEALKKAFSQLDSGPEPPYETQQNVLLEAAPYQPEVTLAPRERPRIFELRVYHSPTWTQLGALHERFAGPEIKIFHRVGIHPILYGSTIIGPNMPNLTYLIPFDNLAAREKAWEAFGADPEWQKVRTESVAKHGQISSVIQISLFRATAYSPIR